MRDNTDRLMDGRAGGIPCAILCGGDGVRIGGGKCFVPLAGRPMIEHVLASVKQVFSHVLISCKDPAPFAHLGLPTIADRFGLQSPLVGIHAVLDETKAERVVFVAVDMPLVRPDLLRLIRGLGRDADIVVPRIGGRFEPLLAVYGGRCLGPIETRLRAGELRTQGFFGDGSLRSRIVTRDEAAAADPRLVSLLNVNTRDRLRRIESRYFERSDAFSHGAPAS